MPTYSSEAILRDGASVTIRSLTAADRDHVISVFQRMSPTSVRHRFFTVKRELSAADLAFLDRLASSPDVALAAIVRTPAGERERALGIGRYVVLPDGRSAKVAFEVGDAGQGRGIGTLLLEHLAVNARRNGIATFIAEVEADNRQMLEMFTTSGFAVSGGLDEHTFHVEFPTEDTERFVATAAAREREAAARSLRGVLAPRSVAVIGASRRAPHSIGRAILNNLIRDGFTGPIYPIHPTAAEIATPPTCSTSCAVARCSMASGTPPPPIAPR